MLSIGLIVADHRYDHLDLLRSTLSLVAYPLHYVASLPEDLAQALRGTLREDEDLRKENTALRHRNLLLSARLQQFRSLEAENKRLRDLLKSSRNLVGDELRIAELVEVDLDPSRHQVLIDKGRTSGVFVGQAVLDANAVMGQVIEVAPFSATVLLITDATHSLPVQVIRNGLRAVAAGNGLGHRLALPHLPNNADIVVGDQLVTSGLGGRFPPGYPVARVVEVTRESGKPFATVVAEPNARLDRSREVLLVWSSARRPDEAVAEDIDAP